MLRASVREQERAREIEFALWGQRVWVRVCESESERFSLLCGDNDARACVCACA